MTTFEQIEQRISQFRSQGKRLFVTSSFQTHSLVLLHIISRIDRDIPVWLVNTGYLFPETLSFSRQIAKDFGLTVREVHSDTPRNLQVTREGRLLFSHDPDYCCALNKTIPVESLLRMYDIWINGIRADQNDWRSTLRTEQPAPFATLRYHPMLDWSERDIYAYLRQHELPRHPLEAEGYVSIGCEPCTRKLTSNMAGRDARWFGQAKTECGLHTDLIAAQQ